MKKASFFGWLFLSLIVVSACSNDAGNKASDETATSKTDTQNHTSTQADLAASEQFVGCYTFNKDDLAMIKISHDNSFAMQMKNNDKNNVWDTKEPMVIDPTGFEFFKVNTLDISQTNIQSVIKRTDDVMAIALLDKAFVNVKGLDSTFAVNLAGAVTTIYKVDCDDIPMDLM